MRIYIKKSVADVLITMYKDGNIVLNLTTTEKISFTLTVKRNRRNIGKIHYTMED
jgi:hypothetical protein